MLKTSLAPEMDLLATVLADADEPLCEVWLDTTAMNLPGDFWVQHAEACQKAHAAMLALEAGSIANIDEHRQVGHYWLRDPGRAQDPKIQAAIEQAILQVQQFARSIHTGAVVSFTGRLFRKFLLIGIGGSALGPQLLASALGGRHDRLRPFFLDNTDPDGFDRVLSQINSLEGGLEDTMVLVVSKSGGTKETRNGMLVAQAAFAQAGLPWARHAVAVTQPGSELSQTAVREGFLAEFPMWDFVGGRTSVLSVVGLLPAALMGLDTDKLLAGARAMDQATRTADPTKNPALKMAACFFEATAGQGKRDLVVLPYKDRLDLLSRYLQQLVMESLGKELDRQGRTVHQGLTVYGNKGATDQHAYVQQLRDGVDNFFVAFIEVLSDHVTTPTLLTRSFFVEENVTAGDYLLGFLLGTQRALSDKGRRHLTLTLTELSERTLGALIALFERTVGYYAELINVNAYHQPGVEAGKVAASAVLWLQHELLQVLSDTPCTVVELCERAGTRTQVAWAWKVLEHLAQNGRIRRERTPGGKPMQTKYRR